MTATKAVYKFGVTGKSKSKNQFQLQFNSDSISMEQAQPVYGA